MIEEKDEFDILEKYLENYSDITELANEHLITPYRVRQVLSDKGVESENLQNAVKERIDIALRKSMSRDEAIRFIRPDNVPAYNRRKYGEKLHEIGFFDRDKLEEETGKYLVKNEVDELAAAYWMLKENNLGIHVNDLAYFFNEGLNYDEVDDKPSDVDEVVDFLAESQIEDDPWFKMRDEYLIPSFSEYAEQSISEVEGYVLKNVYDGLTKNKS